MQQNANNIIKPQDCLLVIGIPLTIESFMKNTENTSSKDFAKSVKRGFKLNDSQLIEKYKQFIELFQKNIDEIRKLGGNVVTDFSLHDLKIISEYKVFTLLSHWRTSKIQPSDFKDINKVKDIIIENPKIFNELSTHIKTIDAGSTKEELSLLLNELIEDKLFLKNSKTVYSLDEFEHPAIYIQYLNRNFLESIFEDNLEVGNSIELFDGMYSIDKFVKCIPNNFANLFDLSICNSIMLQDEIKKSHRQCIVFASKDTVRLDYKIIFYKGLIKKLQQKNMSYIDGYFELIKELKL